MQAEFDTKVAEALRASNGELKLLLIVSRLVRIDTPEFEALRRSALRATQDSRAPKSRLDKASEPIEGGSINEVTTADGFKASESVVYFAYALSSLSLRLCSSKLNPGYLDCRDVPVKAAQASYCSRGRRLGIEFRHGGEGQMAGSRMGGGPDRTQT